MNFCLKHSLLFIHNNHKDKKRTITSQEIMVKCTEITSIISIFADKHHMQIRCCINKSILILGLSFIWYCSARTEVQKTGKGKVNGRKKDCGVSLSHRQRYNLFIGITVLQSAMTVKNLMTWGKLSATAFSSSTSTEKKWHQYTVVTSIMLLRGWVQLTKFSRKVIYKTWLAIY